MEELSAEAKSLGAWEVVLRIRGLIKVARQYTYREVAACLGIISGTVSNWVRNCERDGDGGLVTKPRSGRPAELTEEELWLLADLVDGGALASGFANDLWDARRIATGIRSHFGISSHPHHVAKLLRARGFSVQKPPRVLALADAAAQYRWETAGKPRLARRARRKAAPIFCEEEMTLATQSPVHRTWARVGQTPQCRTCGRYTGVKALGAVSGLGGFRYRVQLDSCSPETFRAFLLTFRASTDGYLLLILDGAPSHKGAAVTDFAQEPRNELALCSLPSYRPALNPQEPVWKVLRKQHTHNRCFTTTADTMVTARRGFRSLQRSSVLQGI